MALGGRCSLPWIHTAALLFSFQALKNIKQVREQFPVLCADSMLNIPEMTTRVVVINYEARPGNKNQSWSLKVRKLWTPIPGQIGVQSR